MHGAEHLENDIAYLLETIRKHSPNAEILWLGVWNKNEKIQNALPGICERLNMTFIGISDLYDPNYQSLVAEPEIYYPNNEAMQIISNRIVEVLKYTHEMD